ncbi:hypothetical protein BBO_06295 [Beauveria brongniartii RCEF 3172]|uniref:HNH nuclease domain-containing protein n=1 Tax=Beauveria brongniartii RCEF 3172 TaxID=1081107 RepID=A0A167B8H7_9HYPO|nr:hypothetical protein BBO_06295 [Beauveria brongniartii RCEF 3172]
MSTAANQDKIARLVADYLEDPSCSRDELVQFLSSRYILNAHVPMADEELEERLEHMKNIQRLLNNNQADVGDAEMTRIAASFCLLLPLAKLQELRNGIQDRLGDVETAFKNLLQTVTLYRTCKLLKNPDEKEEAEKSLEGGSSKELEPTKALEEQGEPPTPQTKWKNKRKLGSVDESIHSSQISKKVTSSGPTSGRSSSAKAHASNLPSIESMAAPLRENPGGKWRNEKQKKDCLKRDNEKCIFTHCKIVEVCHILGWALQNTGQKIDRVRKSMEELFAYFGYEKKLKELLRKPTSSDKSWNMLTLNRLLHSLWGDGQIALQCMGITPTLDEKGRILDSSPATITLRFFWLNVKKDWRANDKFKLSYDTLSEMYEGRFLQEALPGNQISRDEDCRRVVTGNEVDITLPLDDAQSMQVVINAQWHCLNIWAMSGAATDFALAKPEDFEPDDCGDLLEVGVLPTSEYRMDIDQWLQDSS